jgi:hypothetical protein
MKQIVVTLLILFAQLVTSAQAAECKGVRVETDSFTNERTIHTENRMLTDRVNGFVGRVWGGKASEVLVRAISEGEKSYIAIDVRLLKTYSSSPSDEDLYEALNVKKGAKLMVLMDDESIVKLSTERDFRATARYDVDVDGNYGVDARVTALYTLDAESADALTSGEAMVIRVAIESGRLGLSGRDNSINFGTNSKSRHFFKEAVLCLQQDHSAKST